VIDAHIDCVTDDREEVMGGSLKHRTHLTVVTDIIERLLNLCAANKLKVGGSHFCHKIIHKWTGCTEPLEPLLRQAGRSQATGVLAGRFLEGTLFRMASPGTLMLFIVVCGGFIILINHGIY